MSSVVISGDTSGAITLSAPAVAGTNTITLPASTGTVLTTGSPQSGGVIQVVQGTLAGSVSTSSSTYVTSGLTASITPKFSTSKILILVNATNCNISASGAHYFLTVYRNGSTNLAPTGSPAPNDCLWAIYGQSVGGYLQTNGNISIIDSPATTSSTTYTVYQATESGATGGFNWNQQTSYIQLLEIAA